MNFNEKLINLRKSKGLSQEELGNELKVSRQTISKWESCQSYPDFQRLVLLSDYFGLTLDELVRDIDVQEVREKNLNNEKLSSIYSDMNEAKSFIRVCLAIGVVVLIFFAMIVTYGIFFVKQNVNFCISLKAVSLRIDCFFHTQKGVIDLCV